ncbi:hypothetical protein, partial [Daejeonella sp.]|uniref:hypothetical protein n=1 Tax=Daejeonella sp. TaxID=2805397 RepID=UPI0030BCB469
MATHKNIPHRNPASFNYQTAGQTLTNGVWEKYLSFVDSQKPNAVAWWVGSLMIHGCILVPITFLVTYSFGGPAGAFLFISMCLFFINMIANMGSSAFRFDSSLIRLTVFIKINTFIV